MILMIDNYDSFTYNLVQLFGALGQEVRVFRNDVLSPDEAERLRPDYLVVSPGPGTPQDAGASVQSRTRKKRMKKNNQWNREREAPITVMTTFPFLCPCSTYRCASAACSNG